MNSFQVKTVLSQILKNCEDLDDLTVLMVSDGMGFETSYLLPVLESHLLYRRTRIFAACIGADSNLHNLKRMTTQYGGDTLHLPYFGPSVS